MIPFLITIDTEGDNLWSKPSKIETNNSKGLERFQSLCNEYGFKPVYLTNYEMATDSEFVKFAKKTLSRKQCEIGMHLHPWNSPPLYSLTDDDLKNQPFLMEYPPEVIANKVDFMTTLLENTFETKIYSHRAGRWGFNEVYYQVLEKYSYHTDCSVTPHVDWSKVMGIPQGNGGINFTCYPDSYYFPDRNNLFKIGNGRILEVPATIVVRPRFCFTAPFFVIKDFLPYPIKRATCKTCWLRPMGNNLDDMLYIIDHSNQQKYLEFMIHSSELSAGLNPTFQTKDSIETLYKHIKIIFEKISRFCYGSTLEEFYKSITSK